MNKIDVMKELEALGTEQAIKIYKNHGADLELYGVSMANLKKLLKKVKKDSKLGLELLFSKNIDAMYMSQWMVDPNDLTRNDLESILDITDYYMIIDNVVASIAAKKQQLAFECLHEWIDHENKRYRQAAYSLYTLIVMSYDNSLIDLSHVKSKLELIRSTIHEEENRVRYSMNSFLIACGIYLEQYTELAKEIGEEVGKVTVYMGKTSCKVPDAVPYIEKVEKMNKIGVKRRLT